MSDEYSVTTNFQRTDDERAAAEYVRRMRRVREREDELNRAMRCGTCGWMVDTPAHELGCAASPRTQETPEEDQ